MKMKSWKSGLFGLIALFMVQSSVSFAQVEREGEVFLEDHALYIQEYALINIGSLYPYSAFPAELNNAVINRLAQADNLIGRFFGRFHGPQVTPIIAALFDQYDDFAFQFVQQARVNDNTGMRQTLTEWQQHAVTIANYLRSINNNISSSYVTTLLQRRIKAEAAYILDLVQQNYVEFIRTFDTARYVADQLEDYFISSYVNN